MPLVKSTVMGAVIATSALFVSGSAGAAPFSTPEAPSAAGLAAEFAAAALAVVRAQATPDFALNAQQRGDRRSDGRRGGQRPDGRSGDRRSDAQRSGGGQRSDGGRQGGQRQAAPPPRSNDNANRSGGDRRYAQGGQRSDGERGGRRQGSAPPRRDDRANRSGGDRRYAQSPRAGDRRPPPNQRAAPRRDSGQAYRQGRRDERGVQRSYQRDAYRQGRYDQRQADWRRYHRPDRRRHAGHGPRRAHGYWHPQRNVFVYYPAYSPIGWLTVSYGYSMFPRGYIGDCEVVGQTFHRRGRRYEEVALLCYDDWGYGYIRQGSRRVYRVW